MFSSWVDTVHWPALEAIGTCAATVVALGLAFGSWRRAARDERQRHRATLRALAAIMESINDACQMALDRLREGADVRTVAVTLMRTSVHQSSIKALEQFDLARFRNPQTINWIILVRAHTTGLIRVAEDVASERDGGAGFQAIVEHCQRVAVDAKGRFGADLGRTHSPVPQSARR